MGASDSCLETSICPPAFIPDHSYEIKFNKNLFLRHQRNEIQPILNKGTQWDRTAEETSCSTCISQVRHFVPWRIIERGAYNSLNCAGVGVPRQPCSVSRARYCSAVSISKPVCSFVGNRKSFFLDAFPGFPERRPPTRHAACIRLWLDDDTFRIFYSI